MDVVLDASVQREADPGGFTPTASVAVALAVGHALAVALMESRGFSAEHFSRFHAGGQLGRNLRVRVAEVMHREATWRWVAPDDSLKRVVVEMSRHPLGAACVVIQGAAAGTDHRRRRAPGAGAARRYPHAGRSRDHDPLSGRHRSRGVHSRRAPVDGRPAVADLRTAGGGRRTLRRVGANSRSVSALIGIFALLLPDRHADRPDRSRRRILQDHAQAARRIARRHLPPQRVSVL